jgi:LmbE family N-acetylglucosaminyl deacetylase
VAVPALLVVTAHPDDEVLHFGGLMYWSAVAGSRVTLVCATRGEAGQIADPALATPDTLGAVREAELRASCALLRVADVRLMDYRDSGMAGTADNEHPRAFCRAPAEDVVPRLVEVIRQVRPAIVATWGTDGGYGHPDHVAASRHVTAAFELAGHSGLVEAGNRRSPAALYYAARPPELREEVRAELQARGIAVPAGNSPNEHALANRTPVTLRLDVMRALEVKRAARAAHRTQASPMSRLDLLSADLRRRFYGTEYFHRARPPLGPGERDVLLLRLLELDLAAGTL